LILSRTFLETQHNVPVITYKPIPVLKAKKIGFSEPFTWLKLGWKTLSSLKAPALLFGLVFAIAGATISYLALNNAQMTFAFWSGFLLVAPMLAMAAYHMAQRHDQGKSVSILSFGTLLRNNLGNSLLLVAFLVIVMMAWIRISTLVTAVYADGSSSGINLGASLFDASNMGLLVTLGVVTTIVSLFIFSLLAWSMPILSKGKENFVIAIISSIKAVMNQPGPMLVWGLLVAGLTLLSMATFFLAFVVVFPWLAFATWEGYKRMFEEH